MGVRRVAVIGDIGGQLGVFERVMAELGASTVRLPADLAVVQVGDLVRVGGHGLDNEGCVAAAAGYWAANPGRWVQLLGNHDMTLLGGPSRPSWPNVSNEDGGARQMLLRWWDSRRAQLAIALRCREYGEVLITHAGLTRGRWRRLGAGTDPYAVADQLNAEVGMPIGEVIRGGALTGRDSGSDAELADVTWAEVIEELYAPWLAAKDAPFAQIHGHASPWNWASGDWWPAATAEVRAATAVDRMTRRTVTQLGPDRGAPVAVSTDWMLGDEATTETWPVLVLTVEESGLVR